MKILFIRPIISKRENYLEEEILREFAGAGTEVIARKLKKGPSSIENEYDLCFSAPYVVKEAIRAEQEGFDAVVSYCFANPGVEAAKEAINIPIIGSGEAAIALGLLTGKRIGIITILPNLLSTIRRQNEAYINTGKIACIRSTDISVLAIEEDKNTAFNKLYEQAKLAVLENGADVIVLGCTGFGGFARKIAKRLSTECAEVSVIDPAGASLTMAEAMVRCHAKQGKNTYMNVINKEMIFD